MKVRYLILALVILGSAVTVFASTPETGVLDPICNSGPGGTPNYMFDIKSGMSLPNITATSDFGGVFTFCNHTGKTWNSVDIAASNFGNFATGAWTYDQGKLIAGVGSAPVLCNFGSQANGTWNQPFEFCDITIDPNSVNVLFYNALDPIGDCNTLNQGVHNGCILALSLNTSVSGNFFSGDTGNWKDANGNPVTLAVGASDSFDTHVDAPSVPEPTTMLLLGSGIAVMWRQSRKRRQ